MTEFKIYNLNEVCQVYQPETISKKSLPANGIYPVYGANGKIGLNDKYNHEEPQLLLGCRGSVGSIHISEPFSWINGNAMVVKPFEDLVSRDYLKYALLGGINIVDAISGTAQPQITRESLSRIKIPVPTLEKQAVIVEKLDCTFSEIVELEQSIDIHKDFIAQVMRSLLSSLLSSNVEQSRIGDICTVTSSKRIFKSEYVQNGVPFYRTKELKELSNNKKIKTELYISKERYGEIKEKYGIPKNGDLLMSAVGTIGEVLIVDNLGDFYFKDGNIVWLKSISKEFNSDYLAMCLRNITKALNEVAQGSAYSALTIEKLVEIKIPHIGVPEQLKIVNEFNDLSKTINNLEVNLIKKKGLVIELRQSLLGDAFTQKEEVA